jgi:hypothetical protein
MKPYSPLYVNGEYVDNLELFERGKSGETYMCDCRKKHDAFFNRTAFMNHIKLKSHRLWLSELEPVQPVQVPAIPTLFIPEFVPTLREEQDSEYERSLQEDRQKKIDKQEEEMRLILQESKEAFIKETEEKQQQAELKTKRDIVATCQSGYTIRFVFPNGKRIASYIPESNKVGYMRNFVDVYMIDNGITIPDYEFIIYPNIKVDDSCIIQDTIDNRSTVYIRAVEN